MTDRRGLSRAPVEHLALVGATASGKSELALEAAAALGDVEIVSMDSMQVYRGMDVGTAKPTAAERAVVAHHMIDVAEPDDAWSVARFQEHARRAIAGVEARGRRALLVGGTGLYVRAVVDDLRFPGEDAAVRAELERRGEAPDGPAVLHAELAALDPLAAARIEPTNVRRVVRALEAVKVSGRPFSASGPGLERYGEPVVPVRMAGLRLPAPALDERIQARVERMAAAGLVDEVRRLATRPAGWSRAARQAIGYREVAEHLTGGPAAPTLDEALQATARRTRRFARRQHRWFRRDPRVVWFEADGNPRDLLGALVAWWGR